MSEKIHAIIYTRAVYTTFGRIQKEEQPTLWVPSYEIAITKDGYVCTKVKERPFQTVKERIAHLTEHGVTYTDNDITDPNPQEVFIDKKYITDALALVSEQEKVQQLQEQLKKSQTELAEVFNNLGQEKVCD